MSDAIHKMEGVRETCFYPMNAWVEVEFSCGITALSAEIAEFQRDLANVLAVAKKKRGRRVNIGKPA